MRFFAVKHVKIDPRMGNYIYRRRVPKSLANAVRQTEFVKVLGRTQAEALVAYGTYHQQIEHMRAMAKNGVTGLSPSEQQARLMAMLKGWNADPYSPGRDDNERTWRSVEADKLIAPYEDPDTGEYVDVPEEVDAMARALLGGVPQEKPEPTITDAFKFYLKENAKPIPEQRRKQEQRLRRAERNLIAAVGSDKAVSKLTREDARAWRDMRDTQRASPATIQREKNDLSAVISLAHSELEAGGTNPFSKLKLPKSKVSRQQEREPLPLEVIQGVYAALSRKRPDLLPIWTLLDFTGARPSEISQLLVGEIRLDDPIPHIVIHERDDRPLKTSWSSREVPLIGPALDAAKQAVRGVNDPNAPAFPRVHGAGGMDRLSAALNQRIRTLTKNPKHVAYSLRHNMKDRLRTAEVFHDTQTAIMGHAFGRGEDAAYGGGVSLDQKRVALEKALAGYRTEQNNG